MGQWIQVNDIPFENDHSNGFGYNGKGYVIQGSPITNPNNGQSENQLWEYDPEMDSWSSIGFVPAPFRNLAIGDDMDNKYYFGFGNGRNDMWEYDPELNTFTELPSCPCPGRGHPAFVAHNGKIFMGAGSGPSNDLDDWWVFDFATQLWTQKEDIPGGIRHHPYQFGIGDAIYVGGGHRSNWLKYDINLETWSAINDFPQGRVAGTQFDFNGKGFVLAGDEVDHDALVENQFMMYDPEADQWLNLPFEREMHRWAPSNMIIDSTLYYFGGVNYTGGEDNDVWKFDLTSIGCLAPLSVYAVDVEEFSAGAYWANSPTGNADTLQWRKEGETSWNIIVDPQAVHIIDNLEACTNYEFRVNSSCGSSSVFSPIASFRTKGCGACIDFSYCDIRNGYDGFFYFIDRVKINDFENESGSNNGYEHFTSSNVVEVDLGSTINIEVEPGFWNFQQDMNYKIWLDFDANGDFSNDEMVVNSNQLNGTLTESIIIPIDAKPGTMRMRITVSPNNISSPCDGVANQDGEVEDYCLTILGNPTNIASLPGNEIFSISPNPFSDQIIVSSKNSNNMNNIEIYDLTGKQLYSRVVTEFDGDKEITIPTDFLDSGMYMIKILDEDSNMIHARKLVK